MPPYRAVDEFARLPVTVLAGFLGAMVTVVDALNLLKDYSSKGERGHSGLNHRPANASGDPTGHRPPARVGSGKVRRLLVIDALDPTLGGAHERPSVPSSI